MVRGLELFREHFREDEGSIVLIGGAACDEWFADAGLAFRATRDLDLVLIVEALEPEMVARFRQFVDEGEYEIRERSEGGPPVLYRFAKPKSEDYPFMLELFSRRPEGMDLGEDQTITPVPAGEDRHSLSAILLNAAYYDLLRAHHEVRDGLAIATATALIPMKAHAWLDMQRRQEEGEKIDSRDIKKHRADVFRLAATLPGVAGPALADPILADLALFLEAIPADSADWTAILASIKTTIGGALKPADLIAAVRTYFQLPD